MAAAVAVRLGSAGEPEKMSPTVGCTVLLGREVELVGLGPVCSTFLFEVDLQQKCGVLLQPEAWGFFVTSSVASGGSVGGDL